MSQMLYVTINKPNYLLSVKLIQRTLITLIRKTDWSLSSYNHTTTNMAFNSIRITLLYGIHSGFTNAMKTTAIIESLYTIAFSDDAIVE